MKKVVVFIIIIAIFLGLAYVTGLIPFDRTTKEDFAYEAYRNAYIKYTMLGSLSIHATYTTKGTVDGVNAIDNETVIETTQIQEGEGMRKYTKQTIHQKEPGSGESPADQGSEEFYRDGYIYISNENGKNKIKNVAQSITKQRYLFHFSFDKSMIREQSVQNDEYIFVLDEERSRQKVLDKLILFSSMVKAHQEDFVINSLTFRARIEDGRLANTVLSCEGEINQNGKPTEIKFTSDINIQTKDLNIDFPDDLHTYQEL